MRILKERRTLLRGSCRSRSGEGEIDHDTCTLYSGSHSGTALQLQRPTGYGSAPYEEHNRIGGAGSHDARRRAVEARPMKVRGTLHSMRESEERASWRRTVHCEASSLDRRRAPAMQCTIMWVVIGSFS